MEEIKLCPICDQPVKGRWCRNCHHFVREPVRRKVRSDSMLLDQKESRSGEREAWKLQETVADGGTQRQKGDPQTSDKIDYFDRKRNKPGMLKLGSGLIAGIFVAVIFILGIVSNRVSQNESSYEDFDRVWFENAGTSAPADYSYGDWQEEGTLTEEELLRQYHTHCNMEGHMTLTGTQAAEIIQTHFSEMGYHTERTQMGEPYNKVYSYPGQEESTYFFVSEYMGAYLLSETDSSSYEQYFTMFLESDTVTGELHRYTMYSPDLLVGCQIIEKLYHANSGSFMVIQSDVLALQSELQSLLQDPSVFYDEWEYDGETVWVSIENQGEWYYFEMTPLY